MSVRNAFPAVSKHKKQNFHTKSLEQAAVSICSAAHEVQSQHVILLASLHGCRWQLLFRASRPLSGQEEGEGQSHAAVLLYQKSNSFPHTTPTSAEFHPESYWPDWIIWPSRRKGGWGEQVTFAGLGSQGCQGTRVWKCIWGFYFRKNGFKVLNLQLFPYSAFTFKFLYEV